MILKEPLNFAGRLFAAGESVKGRIPLDMIEILQKRGKLDEQTSDDDDKSSLDVLPLNGGTILSPDDFAELRADDQKDHLKALKIDPASKAEDRFEQYEEWYFEQVDHANQETT